jgi:hypothetical protein
MVEIMRAYSPRTNIKGLQTLDNESSAALKSVFTENDVEYQLVPPRCHRRNTAVRVIRTFK